MHFSIQFGRAIFQSFCTLSGNCSCTLIKADWWHDSKWWWKKTLSFQKIHHSNMLYAFLTTFNFTVDNIHALASYCAKGSSHMTKKLREHFVHHTSMQRERRFARLPLRRATMCCVRSSTVCAELCRLISILKIGIFQEESWIQWPSNRQTGNRTIYDLSHP